MRKKIILFIMIFTILLSANNIVFASKIECFNNSVAELDKINLNNLTIKDGLSSNLITDIYQDSIGYIWIGTEDGLNQYNGNVVIQYNYESNNKNSLTSTHITSINEDKHGNIWVGTNSGLNIISRKDNNKITRIECNGEESDVLSSNIITSIYRDNNDTMWVGTENGLNRYDEENNNFIKYYSDGINEKITNNYIVDLDEDGFGNLWISTKSGIAIIDLSTYNIHNVKENKLDCIYMVDKDNSGNMWIATKEGIFKTLDKSYEIVNYNIDIEEDLSTNITKLLCDTNGDIWLLGRIGLIRHIPSNNETKIYNEGNKYLINNSIRCLYEDRSGVLWVGSNNGVSILNIKQQFDNSINNIFSKYEIDKSSITSFLQDSDNDIWIGTEENGLIQFDVNENNMIRYAYDEYEEKSLISDTIEYIIRRK